VIDNRNRTFHYAVLASLVLHAVLLFTLPDLVDTARRAASIPPQIIARLMEPEPAPAPPVPEKPAAAPETPPARKPEAAKPRVAKPLPQPEAPVVREMRPEPALPSQAPEPPAPAAPPVAAIEPQAASPAPQSTAPSPAPSAAPSPAQAPEALSRDQYRVQLIDEARRHKRYPPLARENNWQGDVRVSVAVAANGRPTVTLRGSSGYEVLDRQALEMFTQAARAVPVPPALRGKEFALEVRAVYGLED
jgi:periplasmic protein TonB